jgi:hypothetical protein
MSSRLSVRDSGGPLRDEGRLRPQRGLPTSDVQELDLFMLLANLEDTLESLAIEAPEKAAARSVIRRMCDAVATEPGEAVKAALAVAVRLTVSVRQA